MEYRKWYDKKITTSLLGYGAMRFTTDKDGNIEKEKADELIKKAYDRGVNYFDTAMPYTDGKNEAFLGESLKRFPRESFYLATKLSLGYLKTKEEVLGAIDLQLKTLQTDYIDFYLLHALNKEKMETIKEWGILDIVKKWQEEGKIKNIGFSFHDDYKTFKQILNMYSWDFCQIQLNYMDTEFQQGIKGYFDCEEKNIPVVVMEPIKGGKLANFNKEVSKIFTDYNSEVSLSSWALRYVGSLPGVKCILSGMNEMYMVDDNLNTFSNFIPLKPEEHKLIMTVKKALKNIFEVNCTKCGYCMPCPHGVDIPGNFSIFNDYAMYKNEASVKWPFSNLKKNDADFSQCIECGECLPKCPQNIDIPNELKRMQKELKFLDE